MVKAKVKKAVSKKVKKSNGKLVPVLTKGATVLIRTAVYHAVGVVKGFHKIGNVDFVQLSKACYVGDTGRFNEATKKPIHTVQQVELEPINDGIMDIQVAIICDVVHTPDFDNVVV